MFVVCKVCGERTPMMFKQEHHEIPQAAVRDGQTISLCSGCHHNLHRIADMLRGGKAGLAEDSARVAYPDDRARARLFDLAKTVVAWMTMKRDGVVSSNEPVNVMVTLPAAIKLAAQQLANEQRGRTGRRLGLAPWIAALVKREVYGRYPALRPPNP
jgi:hypothetical protein